MTKQNLRLYRGLSGDEFGLASADLFRENRQTWRRILDARVKGCFEYPAELDREIQRLHKNLRLEFQHFTDSKKIAESYARKVRGLLVEISVPVEDVLKHFELEFQNFGRRKKQFEIVYGVKGSLLAKNQKRWSLRVRAKNV